MISENEKTIGGALGKKTGVKYRTYTRLKEYCEKFANTLFVNNELEKAIDDILKYPLKEFARETINRQMKAGITEAQLANLVISLREENKLVIINTEEETDNKNSKMSK